MQMSRDWHDIGEFDYAVKKIAKNQAKRIQKGDNLYVLYPSEEETAYVVHHAQITDIQGRTVGCQPYDSAGAPTDTEIFTTRDWIFREVEAAMSAMTALNNYVTDQERKRTAL